MLVGAGAHLVSTAEAQPQLGQDLQHAQATVALDSVKGPDSRQALQKAEVLPHYSTEVGHEEGSDLALHNKKGECETPPNSVLMHAIPNPPRYLPQMALAMKLPCSKFPMAPQAHRAEGKFPTLAFGPCDQIQSLPSL